MTNITNKGKEDKKLIIDYNNIYNTIINLTDFKEKISCCEEIINEQRINYYFKKIYENSRDNIINNPEQFKEKYKVAEIRNMIPFYDPYNEDNDDDRYTKAYKVSSWYKISKDKMLSELTYSIITITWGNKELLEDKYDIIKSRTLNNLKARLVADFLIEKLSNEYDNDYENEEINWWSIIWEFDSTDIVYVVDEDRWSDEVLLKSLSYFYDYYLGKCLNDNIYSDILFYKQINQVYKWLWIINIYKARSKLERDAIIWVLSYQDDYKYKYILSNDKDFYKFVVESEDKIIELINVLQNEKTWVNIIDIRKSFYDICLKEKYSGDNNQINEEILFNLFNPVNTRLYYLIDKYFIWFKDWNTFSNFISENISPFHTTTLIDYATIQKKLEDIIYSYSTSRWNFVTDTDITIDDNKKNELEEILKILPTNNYIKNFPLGEMQVDKEDIINE